jgi:pimeloyl-ACP methyl ester carboxylesterase
MSELTTHTLEAPGAVLTYDVRQPATPSEHPPLLVFGSPMAASGFTQLVEHLDDRTVITYDPRGAERSEVSPDGRVTAELHAEDMHRIVDATGLGPVDAFGSSGGGAFALRWVVDHPDDVRTLVAHEPPLMTLLEDRDVAERIRVDIVETYQREGFGPAMAKFIQMVMHAGPLPADYLDRPAPDPSAFGLPTEDDGSRDDALLSRNLAMPTFEPDIAALRASSVRIVPAVGAEGAGTMARRGGEALAAALGVEPVVFPGDHGGFMVSPWAPSNDPAAFAATLREILAEGELSATTASGGGVQRSAR